MAAEAAYDRTHARHQLAQLERLDQVVVGTEIEPGDTVVQAIAGREHQHGRAIALLSGAAQYFEARPPGQAEIQQHGSVIALRQCILREHAVADPVHGEAVLGQRLPQALTDHVVVFHEQDAHRSATFGEDSAAVKVRSEPRAHPGILLCIQSSVFALPPGAGAG